MPLTWGLPPSAWTAVSLLAASSSLAAWAAACAARFFSTQTPPPPPASTSASAAPTMIISFFLPRLSGTAPPGAAAASAVTAGIDRSPRLSPRCRTWQRGGLLEGNYRNRVSRRSGDKGGFCGAERSSGVEIDPAGAHAMAAALRHGGRDRVDVSARAAAAAIVSRRTVVVVVAAARARVLGDAATGQG